ncbi:hypothetical protein TRFO_05249 [Tritrichomonas foetus]|uniref:Uncharacterized protein n=1 Tax=Tritrichomonas foetus TaxID=1144522 RepID=A0A1J4K9K1_9EUKA|nr:hypothetical protein TRFO_05249 [Tritrichomonas foetus]|eukprot:OHT07592.1 hypothetical protein TRFO_05249 [Tritrichomonas foetus]
MSSVQWNLDPLEVTNLDIIQISIIPEALDKHQSTNDKRLLALSHSLAYKRIPAFFLQKSPTYSSFPTENSVVMVFDLNRAFNPDDLFNWCEYHRWNWIVTGPFQDALYDDFQRALNVVSYYEFERLKPLYFSSFLLFPGSDSISDPFLYQKIPIRRETTLCIRTSMQGSLDFIIDYRQPVEAGSYILVPPYEHPFYVVSSSDVTISMRSIDKSIINIDIQSTLFVLITHPCVILSKFFVIESSTNKFPQNIPSKFDQDDYQMISNMNGNEEPGFDPVNFHDYTSEDIDNYLMSIFVENDTATSKTTEEIFETTVIEYPELTVDQILSQIVHDRAERKSILKCLGNGTLPSKRVPLNLAVSTFLSFFRFDFGFGDVKPPFHAQSLITGSTCTYERLGIPDILINHSGTLMSTPAASVVDQWEEQRYQPISGPKSGHFVVFCQSSIEASSARSFFVQFCNIYKQMNFGSLTPFPHDEAFHFVLYEEMPNTILSFFNKNPLSQFQQHPVLSFIVGPPIYDKHFLPPSIISYVRPELIQTSSESEMRTLAFVVYSRIRNLKPCPYGMIAISPKDIAILFFGYRYQPPFLLKRQQKSMTFHIAWDERTKMSAWIDDIGSILHVIPNTDFSRINGLLNDAKAMIGIEMKFTLSILAEGISADLHKEITDVFHDTLDNMTLFAVSPAPTVQVLFKEQFDDDAVIFAPNEQFLQSESGSEYIKPYSTCYVVAHTLPAYSISLYSNDVWKPGDSVVFEYAKQMSHLSWLSVKPGSEVRTISYPPHICALLRKTAAPVRRVSRYEFLRSLERI